MIRLSYKIQIFSGELILDYYKNNGKLDDGSRNILVEIVIAYMVRNKKPMSLITIYRVNHL